MTPYQSFLRSIFGHQYSTYTPYLHGLNLYCLFVVTFSLSLCVYTLQRYQYVYDRTFKDRVHSLRVKYAAARRPGYD